MRARRRRLTLLLALGLAGCRTGTNYGEGGPRYAGERPATAAEPLHGRTLRIVSFNIERALRVESAIEVMRSNAPLARADVVLLQEMDDPGTKRVAEALGMGYVYYPATRSSKTGRDFGNAVLSRWPIVADSKVLLPHLGIAGRLRRIATGATLDVGGTRVRVYSVHLGTLINGTPAARREQLRTVLDDARAHPLVVIGGDINSRGVGREAERDGFEWPTKDGPRTTRFGRWDHVFLRGLSCARESDQGTVLDVLGASDHRPVWVLAELKDDAD